MKKFEEFKVLVESLDILRNEESLLLDKGGFDGRSGELLGSVYLLAVETAERIYKAAQGIYEDTGLVSKLDGNQTAFIEESLSYLKTLTDTKLLLHNVRLLSEGKMTESEAREIYDEAKTLYGRVSPGLELSPYAQPLIEEAGKYLQDYHIDTGPIKVPKLEMILSERA